MRSTAFARIVVARSRTPQGEEPMARFPLAIGFGGGWDAIRGILDADRSGRRRNHIICR